MLFELNNNDDLNLDYFNLKNEDIIDYDYMNNKNKQYKDSYNNQNIDLNNGFYLGNIFVDTYKPYKNYKPKKINAYSEQQKLLIRLHELDFILNDLNLYLDINPNDSKMFETFKNIAKNYDDLKNKYYQKYQVLELCKDTKNKYTWLDNPWPWDGGFYV